MQGITFIQKFYIEGFVETILTYAQERKKRKMTPTFFSKVSLLSSIVHLLYMCDCVPIGDMVLRGYRECQLDVKYA